MVWWICPELNIKTSEWRSFSFANFEQHLFSRTILNSTLIHTFNFRIVLSTQGIISHVWIKVKAILTNDHLTNSWVWIAMDFIHFLQYQTTNGNGRTMRKIYSKLKIKTPVGSQWRRSGVFIVNFEQISYTVLVFLFMTLNK